MFLASLATVALLAGCGGGDGGAEADDGIASLGTAASAEEETTPTTAPVAEADSADTPDDSSPVDSGPVDSGPIDSALTDSTGSAADTPSTDPEQAMLDFAECMRENGIDMPDPEFSGDGEGGGVMIATQEDAGGDQPSREEREAAHEECEPLMDAAVSDVEIDPEREAEMREQMLEYAACMRDQGIDMPDPEFGENGRVTMSMGDPESEAPAFDDEEFEAANEACGQEGNGIAIGAAPPAGDD